MDRQAILEALFTSRTRVSLLLAFLGAPERSHYSRELERVTGEHQNAVWRELQHLEHIGLLTSEVQGRVKNYRVRSDFPLLAELASLLGAGSQPGAAGRAAPGPLEAPAKGSPDSPAPSSLGAPASPPQSTASEELPYRPELVIGETD